MAQAEPDRELYWRLSSMLSGYAADHPDLIPTLERLRSTRDPASVDFELVERITGEPCPLNPGRRQIPRAFDWRRHQDMLRRQRMHRSVATRPWHRLQFTPGHQPCAAALRLVGFHPAGALPLVPLDECDAGQCACLVTAHRERDED